MIRFACPACQAPFSVADEKAGKQGKCPKCQSAFLIPGAEPKSLPSASASSSGIARARPASVPQTVEIDPCPNCDTRLTISASDVGMNVKCPTCNTTFLAIQSAEVVVPPKAALAPKSRLAKEEPEEEEEEEERPTRRRRPKRRSSSIPPDAPIGFLMCTFPVSPYILPLVFWSATLVYIYVMGRAMYELTRFKGFWDQDSEVLVLKLFVIFGLPTLYMIGLRAVIEVIIAVLRMRELAEDDRNSR